MVCVYCGGNTKVSNSRPQHRSNQVWRRRQCIDCQAVFTTTERHDPAESWVIKDKTGVRKNFISEKLYLSIYESLKHRTSALLDARHLTQTVINKLSRTTTNGTISSELIIKTVAVTLNRFDKNACNHYLAFHQV